MPPMIDYAVLCRAIEDWKAGNAPNIPAPSRPVPVAAETVVDSYDAVDEAAEDVDRAAGRRRHHELDRAIGPGLGRCGDGNGDGKEREEEADHREGSGRIHSATRPHTRYSSRAF